MAGVSLVRRLGAGIKSFSAGFGSGISTFQPYEAAGFSRKRPVIYGAHARDSSLDLSEWTRTELLKLARHMYRNVGLIKGAVDSIAAYSVGPGLRPQYRGTDTEFGKLAEQYWRDVVAPNPEVTGRMTWTDLLLALSRSIDVDGDVFVIMTDKGKLQVVEGHRVCEGDNYESTDGVFLGKMGEPTAYLLELGDTYRKINSDLVIHLMEMERPDQIRGGSNLARALNHVRDLKLLGEFEKDALKLQGSIAAVITSNEGDALASSGGFFGNIQAADTGDTSIAREQITSSATIPRLAPGEKIEMVAPNRPNNGFEPFAKFLIRDVAMGLGLPIEFVYDPASVGGAGMRFIVAKAQRRFEQRQRLLIDRFCNRSWSYFIGRAIANGDLPPAEDYRKVSWQTPKSLTVDAGREEMQARESYKAGLISLQTYHGELGEDWVEQVDQIKAEQTYMSGGTEVSQAPLITKIGEQGARSITAILQSIGMGQITPEQAEVILVTVYGLNKEDAAKIARGGSSAQRLPVAAPITAEPEEDPIPQEPKADATATDTTTPTDGITDVPEQLQVALDCGTGSGGFQPGNSCAGGGDGGSSASEPKERYRDRIEGTDEELKNEERKQKRKIKNLKDKIDQSKQRSEDLRKQIADLNKSISDKSSNYNKQLDVIKKESDRIKSDGVLARQKIQQDLDKKLAAIEEKYKKKREAREEKYRKKREARDAKIAEIESAELESKEDVDVEDEMDSQVAETENEADKLKALIAELKKILQDANNAEKNSEQLAAPSFIMPDDAPDFNLSAKELNMIVTALGIGKTKAKKRK